MYVHESVQIHHQACAKDLFDGDLRQATAETVLDLSHHAAILQSTLGCQLSLDMNLPAHKHASNL